MPFIEMTNEKTHGGGSWDYKRCVWAPWRRTDGKVWGLWNKVLEIRKGDVVIHLVGSTGARFFTGYSIASSDGYLTEARPPNPGKWGYSSKFFRADLEEFTAFDEPINLDDVFWSHETELMAHLERNKSSGKNKKNLFYVFQNRNLQCLNGAYLTDADESLIDVLFGEFIARDKSGSTDKTSVNTGDHFRKIKARIGQTQFADAIKDIYGEKCCFPDCEVTDRRFLIGAHIARWGDNKELRGNLANGLCLCLIHDKAFEIGYFVLDDQYAIVPNPNLDTTSSNINAEIKARAGMLIEIAHPRPLLRAIREHRNRILRMNIT